MNQFKRQIEMNASADIPQAAAPAWTIGAAALVLVLILLTKGFV